MPVPARTDDAGRPRAGRSRVYDLIAFDWDGTLFDSTSIITSCLQAAVRDVGGAVPSDERAAHVIGMGLAQALAYVAPDVASERYPELGARYRHHYLARQHDISLFDGVPGMLAELRERGHHLAVATGKSRAGLDIALRAAQLQGIFESSRTADETASKPDPRMLLELMREFGLEPARVLMVGDTSHDLQMARSAGCASVAVSYGAHASADLMPWSPLFLARSVEQLRIWLRANA